MFRFVCIISLIILFCACSLKGVTNQQLLPSDPALFGQCGQPFIKEPRSFVHRIEASLPMGKTVTMIGVTKIDPIQGTLRGVLMTIEGFVLFDGLWQKEKLTVLRAVPPFDRPAFAESMVNDMCLLFLVPQIASLTHAMQGEGDVICQYRGDGDSLIEMTIHEDQSWSMKVFTGGLSKEIQAASLQDNVPKFMELKGHSYSLKLTTIKTEHDFNGDRESIE